MATKAKAKNRPRQYPEVRLGPAEMEIAKILQPLRGDQVAFLTSYATDMFGPAHVGLNELRCLLDFAAGWQKIKRNTRRVA
jgi:hypothetical protein